ncbi:hypothetical protein TCDM_01731 [Trypanosoma cruzi Dm28c]|uniref:Uncharacterized protein n=1 Tax=Trypanosoma cruzi Dm28c TaxID=1416333 RepID=V5DPW9_TRYCR|nr:hypothetical protein TCDM_01731 [Trypanosoma cruzi Dm28c]
MYIYIYIARAINTWVYVCLYVCAYMYMYIQEIGTRRCSFVCLFAFKSSFFRICFVCLFVCLSFLPFLALSWPNVLFFFVCVCTSLRIAL